MMSDIGESTANINRRSDDETEERALAALRRGGTLHRPSKLGVWYAHDGSDYVEGTRLTRARVRKLEDEGVIKHAGVDRYALAERVTT